VIVFTVTISVGNDTHGLVDKYVLFCLDGEDLYQFRVGNNHNEVSECFLHIPEATRFVSVHSTFQCFP